MRIYLDMDNTIADFSLTIGEDLALKEMYNKDFFLNLKPIEEQIDSIVKELQEMVEVFILTACIKSEYCVKEKAAWLQKNVPSIPEDNYCFIPVGSSKARFVEGERTILVDDYPKNIREWEKAGGIGIRYSRKGKSNSIQGLRELVGILKEIVR